MAVATRHTLSPVQPVVQPRSRLLPHIRTGSAVICCTVLCVLSAVGVQSLPHIVYLSRGRLFEHSGSRELADLKQFAYNLFNRHTQHQQQHNEVDDGSRAIPAPPSSLDVLRDGALHWAGQLHDTVTSLPAVAAALVSVGALLGVLLTVIAFALLLPKDGPRRPPASSATLACGAGGTGKARKAD